MLAVTWANDKRGKSVFWLHTAVRRGIWPSVDDQLGITPRASSDCCPPSGLLKLAGGGPVTIDIDATDVEVYGSKKQGVAYNYQGQRAGPHVAAWAETEIPLAADLLAGDSDPRSHVVTLLGRALAALPQQVRDGAKAAGRKIALRADAGYFAGDLACRIKHEMEFAIGAKRISSMWRAWPASTRTPGATRLTCPARRSPCRLTSPRAGRRTRLLIAGCGWTPIRFRADPRSRRRRTLDPRQRALPIPELEQEPEIYAYSFICTDMDVSTPARAAAAEHWYRHRTVIENIFRDSKHGAALRHLPSGSNDVNTAWMFGSLIAAAIAAWVHQLTGTILGATWCRARHPRRQSDDRHPAAQADRHPRPAGPPRRQPHPAPARARPCSPASWPPSAHCPHQAEPAPAAPPAPPAPTGTQTETHGPPAPHHRKATTPRARRPHPGQRHARTPASRLKIISQGCGKPGAAVTVESVRFFCLHFRDPTPRFSSSCPLFKRHADVTWGPPCRMAGGVRFRAVRHPRTCTGTQLSVSSRKRGCRVRESCQVHGICAARPTSRPARPRPAMSAAPARLRSQTARCRARGSSQPPGPAQAHT